MPAPRAHAMKWGLHPLVACPSRRPVQSGWPFAAKVRPMAGNGVTTGSPSLPPAGCPSIHHTCSNPWEPSCVPMELLASVLFSAVPSVRRARVNKPPPP
nr:unnamed protein product [Digitaria exilis]